MPFLAVGVEHTTAPLSVRERVALEPDEILEVSPGLVREAIVEAAILSTCNRTELYLWSDDLEAAAQLGRDWLTRRDAGLRSYIRVWRELDAAEHLFRVASGLESQVPGEGQILGQVRGALTVAQSAGSVGPYLHALFRSAISCARRARAGTSVGRVERSIGSEAVRAAKSELGTLEGSSALVVGGGEISRLIARELRAQGVDRLWIANRTISVAEEVGASAGGSAIPIDGISSVIPHVNLIFSATSAPGHVISLEDISAFSGDRPLYVYDLAIPRDVDPRVGELMSVHVRNLDTLLPQDVDALWADDIRAMEAVIAAELHDFQVWELTRRVAPVIASLRRHVEAVSRAELKRVEPQLADLDDREQRAVESLTNRLIDKMFHHLVMRLRLAAQTDPSLVEAAEFFFLHGEGGLFEDESQRLESTAQESALS
jgi:glutamyl-tRNA reductase